MQTVSCPSCGAPVHFRSHAAVMSVCEFCRATVVKDGDSVADQGKMAAVLEDYSPIQIGTAGVAGGRNFTVVGRIQLRYEAGFWNEWYLLFDDAASGWLGDSSGMFVITTERAAEGALPAFGDITPGRQYAIGGARYTASEKLTARCTGGQGELPFKVGEGWEARVADFRSGAAFITLDYSDGEMPVVYTGVSVTLAELKCQLLRDDEQIKASAGKYRGKVEALDCPACGSMIKYLPGITSNLVCPACASQLDAAAPQAQVLTAGEKVERVRTTIPLGAQAKISGIEYTVIGAMLRQDEEQSEWTEYLLYSTRGPFFWLIESEDGWYRASVMSTWPAWSAGQQSATFDNVGYDLQLQYRARVVFAAGAFNWRVAAGDEVQVLEFEHGQASLAAELSASEMTWSRSTRVAFDQVKAWFGAAVRGDGPRIAAPEQKRGVTPATFLKWILILNAVPLLFNFWGSFLPVALGMLALYLPAKFFAGEAGDKR